MKKILVILVIISSIWAKSQIVIGVGLSLEPYIIQKTNSGMELDIIKTALNNAGYKLKLQYLPFLRIPSYLNDKKIDAAATINEKSGVKDVFYSKNDIVYQNVVVTLKSEHLHISKISDLKGLRVIAFQNARKYLGKKYVQITKKMKFYQELANQKLQVKLLFAKRVDAIILDKNIFSYIRKNMKNNYINVKQKVKIFQIFPKTYFKVGFLDKKVRDKFNIQLEKIKQNGIYQKIIDKYTK